MMGENTETETGSKAGDSAKRTREYYRRFDGEPLNEDDQGRGPSQEFSDTATREVGRGARDLAFEYAFMGLGARRSADAPDGGGGAGNGGCYKPAPKNPPVKNAVKQRPKGGRARYKGNDGKIYEWDSQHGRWETYNKTGKHLGVLDDATGFVKDGTAVSGRSIEP